MLKNRIFNMADIEKEILPILLSLHESPESADTRFICRCMTSYTMALSAPVYRHRMEPSDNRDFSPVIVGLYDGQAIAARRAEKQVPAHIRNQAGSIVGRIEFSANRTSPGPESRGRMFQTTPHASREDDSEKRWNLWNGPSTPVPISANSLSRSKGRPFR